MVNFLSMGSAFYSHACAASCIASQNHSSNKLLIQDTDRKRFRIVSGMIYCFYCTYTISDMLLLKRRRLMAKKRTVSIPFSTFPTEMSSLPTTHNYSVQKIKDWFIHNAAVSHNVPHKERGPIVFAHERVVHSQLAVARL